MPALNQTLVLLMQHLQDDTSTLAHVGLASKPLLLSHQNKCTTLPWPPFTATTLLLLLPAASVLLPGANR